MSIQDSVRVRNRYLEFGNTVPELPRRLLGQAKTYWDTAASGYNKAHSNSRVTPKVLASYHGGAYSEPAWPRGMDKPSLLQQAVGNDSSLSMGLSQLRGEDLEASGAFANYRDPSTSGQWHNWGNTMGDKHTPPSKVRSGVVNPFEKSYVEAVNPVASTGEKIAEKAASAGWHIPKPGLFGTAIAGGLAGYYGGDQDAGSFGLGVAGGLMGGKGAEMGAEYIANHLTSVGQPMGEIGQKALAIGEHLTSKGGRGALFAAGALLGGGMFSSMFSSGRKSYKSGFNQNRGNSF